MRCRTLLPLLAVSLSLIAVGCGSSSSSTAVSSPLATELSYFPTGSPLVAAIATDPQGAAVQNLQGLLGAFPVTSLGITALESKLQSLGVNYRAEIEPLFGNPITLGALQVPRTSPLTRSSFLAVWITKSAGIATLIKGVPGLAATGSVDGATLYGLGTLTAAVDGATVVLGSSRSVVSEALNRHAHGGGLRSADFSTAMTGLPQDALVRAFGSFTGAFGSARKIPWVAAIRGYAASLSATRTGISVRFRLDTSGRPLTSSQLPIASGTAAPELAGTLPIAVGVHDPAQTVAFIEAAMQAAGRARRKAHADLKALASLITGDLIVESDTQTTMGRAAVSDPASAARQLAKLGGVVREPGGFYAIKVKGGKSVNLGLVGNELVAGNAAPAQLRAFATAPATPVAHAQGSVAFRVSLVELAKIGLGKTPSTLIQSILSILGEITGSAFATPAALTAHLDLPVK